MSPFEIMQNMINSAPGAQPGPVPPAPAPESASKADNTKAAESEHDAELQELKQRIQELEALVLKSKGSSAPKKRAHKGAKG
jgi:hypothetical protein